MLTLKQIIFASVIVSALLTTAAAQDSASSSSQRSSLSITAAAAGERVRITAPSAVVQMRVEVYAASGAKLFDQEIRGGNVFDWHLQDGQAQRLPSGSYVCVVTAKSVSGKLTQKIGTVRVEEKSASVQPAEALSAPQAQTIGPVEENSSWMIAGPDEPQTPTVIANDGADGQIIRGRGALTFRIGNFFSGIDQEQMRLTEAGNLGIGTSAPQAKLDVAGTIRAERFLIAKPKLTGVDKAASDSNTLAADSGYSVQPLTAGTGTPNQIAKWILSDTLGDSGITETAGGVGIGTTGPGAPLHVFGTTSGFTPLVRFSDNNSSLGAMQYFEWRGGAVNNKIHGIAADGNGLGFYRLNDAGNAFLSPSPDLVLSSNGNVGLGTTGPAAPFHVFRTTSGFTPIVRFSDNNSSLGAMQYFEWRGGAVNNKIHGIAADGNGLGFYRLNDAGNAFLSPTPDLVIRSSGNVGIGTTSPISKLHIVSGAGDAPPRLQSAGTNTFGAAWEFYHGGAYKGFVGVPDSSAFLAPGEMVLAGVAGTKTSLWAGGNRGVTLETNGNVGIGISSPSAPLHINAPAFAPPAGLSAAENGLLLGTNGTSSYKWIQSYGGPLSLNPQFNNVGIGISNPSGPLHINAPVFAPPMGLPTAENGLLLGTNGTASYKWIQSYGGPLSLNPQGNSVGIGTNNPDPHYKLVVEAASGGSAVLGVTVDGTGVTGRSDSGDGVIGISQTGDGARFRSVGGFGVFAASNDGAGLFGASLSGPGGHFTSNMGNIVSGSGSGGSFHINNSGTYVAGSDFAEALPARGGKQGYEPGDVLVVSTEASVTVEKSSRPYDVRVAGVYSTRPGMLGADKNGASRVDANELPVAIVGIVPTKVSAENGPVQVGDLLATSRTPGYAMRASPILMRGVKIYRTGTILGKALEPLKQGKGVIKVLVMLR